MRGSVHRRVRKLDKQRRYVDPTTGAEQPVPTNYIFLAALIVNLLIVIPMALMLFKRIKQEPEQEIITEDTPPAENNVDGGTEEKTKED